MAIRCTNCGNENPDDYVYCDECGARLPAPAAAQAPVAAPAPMAPAPVAPARKQVAQRRREADSPFPAPTVGLSD